MSHVSVLDRVRGTLGCLSLSLALKGRAGGPAFVLGTLLSLGLYTLDPNGPKPCYEGQNWARGEPESCSDGEDREVPGAAVSKLGARTVRNPEHAKGADSVNMQGIQPQGQSTHTLRHMPGAAWAPAFCKQDTSVT